MSTTRVRWWLWPLRVIGVLVPRRLRADWRQEWETELRYREMLLAEWDRLGWRSRLELLRRSASVFWDALWLQRKRLEAEVFQDLRYGVRMLLTHPGFTTVAVVTLALGIGANTAIFTLLDKVLIRQLPVEQPHRLVTFVEDATGAPRIISYPMYADLRDRNDVLAGLVAFFQRPFSLNDGSQSQRVIGMIVSGITSTFWESSPSWDASFFRRKIAPPGRIRLSFSVTAYGAGASRPIRRRSGRPLASTDIAIRSLASRLQSSPGRRPAL